MKKSTLLILMASSFAILGMQASIAGNRPGAVTFTPGVGYYAFSAKRDLNNTAVLPTIGLAYNFDDQWAIEGAYGHVNTTYDSSRTGSVLGNVYTVSGLYRLAKHNMFEPYISAGAGVLYLNPNGNNPTNQANINVGLGSQIFFDDSIALRAEVKDLYMTAGNKNDVMLNFGVSFLIGGHADHVSYKGEDLIGDK